MRRSRIEKGRIRGRSPATAGSGTARLLVIAALAAALSGCGGAEQEESIQIGGVPVPRSSYSALGEPERQGLADLIGFGAAVARGELGALGAPIIERAVLRSRLANLPYHLGAAALGIDERALRSSYDRAPEWELLVRHVVLLADVTSSGMARDSARRVAAEVAERARAGEDFATLAARYSQEPGAAERGGLLQPGRRGSWVEPFWNTALALQPGETSGVVESEFGYHVLRLDERRPVPFEEADRASLLRRVVSTEAATRAMEEWSATDRAIEFDDAAMANAYRLLMAGVGLPDTLRLANDSHGVFEGVDLATSWATLAPAERVALESGDGTAFRSWLRDDAQQTLRGRYAMSIGVPADPDATSNAQRDWSWTTGAWVAAFGFQPDMTDQQLIDSAMQALLSGAQEARAARLELRTLRPLLRQTYPLVDAGAPEALAEANYPSP
jgi:hypothetical protein